MAILRTDATMNSDLEAQDNTKVGEVTENEDTPDETSRELKNMVEQNVPLAQTIEEKEDESPSPKVLVNEKSSLLMFAPNWTKNDSKEGQVLPMEFHMEARGPPPVPTGDQDGTAPGT